MPSNTAEPKPQNSILNVFSLPDLSDSQYRIFNALRTLINLSQVQVTSKICSIEWFDAFLSMPDARMDDKIGGFASHASSSYTKSFNLGAVRLNANSSCGVYLEHDDLTINEFQAPSFTLDVLNHEVLPFDDLDGELDEEIGLCLLDYLNRNINLTHHNDFELNQLRTQLISDLANELDVAPKKVFGELLKKANG